MKLLLINTVVKALWTALRGRHTRKYGATLLNDNAPDSELSEGQFILRPRAGTLARARAKYELALTRVRVYSGAAIFAHYNTI